MTTLKELIKKWEDRTEKWTRQGLEFRKSGDFKIADSFESDVSIASEIVEDLKKLEEK